MKFPHSLWKGLIQSNHTYDHGNWIHLLPHQLPNMPTNLALGPAAAPPTRFSPAELRAHLSKQVSAKLDNSECQNSTSTHENSFTSEPESQQRFIVLPSGSRMATSCESPAVCKAHLYLHPHYQPTTEETRGISLHSLVAKSKAWQRRARIG